MTRASAILFWFSLTLIVSLGLYHTSYRVEDLSRQLKELNAEIAAEQRNLHVLKAEWVYLSNPARLEAAARKHLALQATDPSQVTKLTKLAHLVPTRQEAMGTTTVAAAPIANLRIRPAAHAPKSGKDEQGRINTRMFIRKTAAAAPTSFGAPLPVQDRSSYTIADTGVDP